MSHSVDRGGPSERDSANVDAAQDKKDFKDTNDRSSKLFDLRFLVGGLFTLYGLMVGIAGLFDSSADLTKSDGVRINLWTGLGMLVLGLLFLLWAWRRPVLHSGSADTGDGAGDARGGAARH